MEFFYVENGYCAVFCLCWIWASLIRLWLFPVFLGAMIFLPIPFVIMFWIGLIVTNALHNHSGFTFSYPKYSVHHDWHHYSSIGLCDKIFGTDKPFEEMITLKTKLDLD